MQITAKTRVFETSELHVMYREAYFRVINPDDREGPIDALVPWEAAGLFTAAIEFMTSEKPTCVYRRPMFGHLTHPGLRAVLTKRGQEQA